MTPSGREIRALVFHQLDILNRVMEACPANEMAMADLKPELQRLNEIVEAYLARKPQK